MKRIREVLARLARAASGGGSSSGGGGGGGGGSAVSMTSKDESPVLNRTSSTARSSHSGERMARNAVVLYDGIRDGELGVDIVMVHSLYGDRVGSWSKGDACWPRDFLGQDVPDARIISWGWANAAFSDQAELLLADIARIRVGTTRPVIFVGHGLGGLVVKEALVTAAVSRIYGSHTELGNIYPRTVGCIFLGTPHTRSGKRSLGDIVASTAMLAPRPPSQQLLRSLRENDGAFEHMHSTWLLISRDIKVVCVREEKPTARRGSATPNDGSAPAGPPPAPMVPRDSAVYEGLSFNVVKDDIRADHIEMARFASRDDLGYLQLVAHITKIASGPTQAEIEAREMRNQEILDALYFDTMMERESGIDPAHGHTCEWFLRPQSSPFCHFLNSSEPVLWISGRAGSGKSTLMKYAWQSPELRRQLEEGWAKNGDLHMACFFMFEGGSRIQKSYEGFLRGVMYQILSARRDLIKTAFPSFFDCSWPPPMRFTSITNLNQGFYSLFAHMSEKLRLFVFIDGIDEYRIMERKDHYEAEDLAVQYADSGDEMWGQSTWMQDSQVEIARLINSMAAKDTAKFVVTSRELPVFEEAFAGMPHIRLQEHTIAAIAEYVEDRLLEAVPGLPDTKNLCAQVAQRSQGDVLWARLAIDMVVDCSLRTLRPTLDSLPALLGGPQGLYMRMLLNLTKADQMAACKIFHLVLRAQQPPHLITLAFAEEGYLEKPFGRLRSSIDSEQPHSVDSIQHLADQEQRHLQTSCAGLLVAEGCSAPSKVPLQNDMMGNRVVFAHQTAKEWVGRKDIWDQLRDIHPPGNVELDFCLLSACVRHLKALGTLRPLQVVNAWPNPRFRPNAWLLIANALRYAERIDSEATDVEQYLDLIDDLDQTCQATWLTALRNDKPFIADPDWYDKRLPKFLKKHWTAYEPMEAGKPPRRKYFLTLAVQANLVRYVRTKLKQLDEDERQKKAQELLVHVVSPNAEGFSACVGLSGEYLDFHHDMPDSRFLDILFENGALLDSTDSSGDNAWIKALKTGRRYFSPGSITMSHLMETGASRRLMMNRQRWVAAIKSLLKHGADPNAEIQLPVMAPSTSEDAENASNQTSVKTATATDLMRETLEGEPEYAHELVELEALMGRRGSVGLAR